MDIYFLDLNKINLNILKEIEESSLSVHSSKIELKKKQHLAGRFLLKHLAQNIYNISDIELFFKNNKPYFKNSDLFFNISHSQNIVAIAFSKNEIGLDIEYNQKNRNFVDIIERFDKNLANEISTKSKDEQKKLFYDFWTAYEAKIKINSQQKTWTKTLYPLTDYTLTVCSTSQEEINIKEIRI